MRRTEPMRLERLLRQLRREAEFEARHEATRQQRMTPPTRAMLPEGNTIAAGSNGGSADAQV
jgi:hypothetical protein